MRDGAVEVAVADLAASQWGLVTSAQAARLGVTRMQLSRLVRSGLLIRLSHGVHLSRWVGFDEFTDLRAAWLKTDPARTADERLAGQLTDVAVSHASAAELLDLGSLFPARLEFTSSRRRQTRNPAVRLHHRPLAPSEVTTARGLPVTRPARTVLDLLSDHHDGDQVAQILGEAHDRGILDVRDLAAQLGPLAATYGHPAGDGAALLEHLFALAGRRAKSA